ncbi:VOC family protein [Nocardioides panacisoli]|uniref:VOC family protein n=1 Tax=Nocardioides panacisoli TaxID=627624 RepID=UPI0031E0496F
MQLENVVFDAVDPQAVGRFWESELGTEPLTDEEAGYETRLAVPDGPVLDLCFQRVAEPPTGPQRLHLEIVDDADTELELTDPGGNPFTELPAGSAYADDSPLATIVLAAADPERDRRFWSWLTGWEPVDPGPVVGLRHPSHRGPLLELRPEAAPKGEGKNRIHLDVRLEPGEDADAVATAIVERGGRELHFDWGELPWRHFADPSGNEFCMLRAPV